MNIHINILQLTERTRHMVLLFLCFLVSVTECTYEEKKESNPTTLAPTRYTTFDP